jgi:HemK-like putative methylase
MIELLLRQPDLPEKPRLGDVGAGSGALGITAKLELPDASIDLIEIDPAAINTTKMNVMKHTTSVSIIQSDLLAKTPQDYDVLLCNLPYVPDEFHINEAAMREPKLAIFGGSDGLEIYRKLFRQIQKMPIKPLLILCESLPPQHEILESIANESGYLVTAHEDFIQAFKREA